MRSDPPDTTAPDRCHFGHPCPPARLTRCYFPEGCWCYPDDHDQWLCPQHTIKGLQNNAGTTVQGYLHTTKEDPT